MSPIRLTASQWIEKYRRGAAIMVGGRRHVIAYERHTGGSACVEVEVENPDARCALVDGQLDAAEIARVLIGLHVQLIRYSSSAGPSRSVLVPNHFRMTPSLSRNGAARDLKRL